MAVIVFGLVLELQMKGSEINASFVIQHESAAGKQWGNASNQLWVALG